MIYHPLTKVLCGELLREAEKLIDARVHPQTIAVLNRAHVGNSRTIKHFIRLDGV